MHPETLKSQNFSTLATYLAVTCSCLLMTSHETYPLLLPAKLFNTISEPMFSSTAQDTELGFFYKLWSVESHEIVL